VIQRATSNSSVQQLWNIVPENWNSHQQLQAACNEITNWKKRYWQNLKMHMYGKLQNGNWLNLDVNFSNWGTVSNQKCFQVLGCRVTISQTARFPDFPSQLQEQESSNVVNVGRQVLRLKHVDTAWYTRPVYVPIVEYKWHTTETK